ncbi:hypothetical protein IEQ34_016558 [Dendrobium chrysotoxum]|uniref:Uncharacterized protein n=1 Tax=Dendrobium chrysotoxum TaxID=161865 RepID=A0AAV7FYF1_DENCH|nr:hypothetical protein IEQ34_016558 [Dendrobium chrysotoxum]
MKLFSFFLHLMLISVLSKAILGGQSLFSVEKIESKIEEISSSRNLQEAIPSNGSPVYQGISSDGHHTMDVQTWDKMHPKPSN